jgi:protein involved in polysaccharide export with SLBB domain
MAMNVASAVRRFLGVSFAAVGLSIPASAEPPSKEEAAGAKPAPPMSADDIKPLPLAPIPDDPPPHEGAMIGLPYVVEPPDLVLVEVLEALPGRPLSGERLVRPDGTIDLGFYGSLSVRGLTASQIKTKLILKLRTHITDETLGLYRVKEELAPFPPGDEPGRLKPRGPAKTPSSAITPTTPGAAAKVRQTSARRAGPPSRTCPKSLTAPRLIAQAEPPPPAPPPSEPQNRVVLPAGSNVRITIEVQNHPGQPAGPPMPDEAELMMDQMEWELVDPADSDRVFVDITAYNSKTYYVQGDVAQPGRLPWTGRDTVLDALNYAGNIIPSGDPKDIKLVRPARGGKPAKVYQIDYEAILQRGDARANLQLFPGDRLIVGRNETIKKTIALDRATSALQSAVANMNQYANMLRVLGQTSAPTASGLPPLTPAQREAIIKMGIDLWREAAGDGGAAVMDDKTFRGLLERALNPPEVAPKGEAK